MRESMFNYLTVEDFIKDTKSNWEEMSKWENWHVENGKIYFSET